MVGSVQLAGESCIPGEEHMGDIKNYDGPCNVECCAKKTAKHGQFDRLLY